MSKEVSDQRINFKHIDEFVNDQTIVIERPELAYPHFLFSYWRLSSVLKMAYFPFMRSFKLFVEYEGCIYRVTGASRLGDVYLSRDFEREHGYDLRVLPDFNKFKNWSRVQPHGDLEMNENLALRKALDATIARSSPATQYRLLDKYLLCADEEQGEIRLRLSSSLLEPTGDAVKERVLFPLTEAKLAVIEEEIAKAKRANEYFAMEISGSLREVFPDPKTGLIFTLVRLNDCDSFDKATAALAKFPRFGSSYLWGVFTWWGVEEMFKRP